MTFLYILQFANLLTSYLIYRRLQKMPTVEQFETAFAQVDAETTRLANLILELLAQQNQDGLSEVEEVAIFDKIVAAAERLKGVGASVEEPVPPVEEPTVIETIEEVV